MAGNKIMLQSVDAAPASGNDKSKLCAIAVSYRGKEFTAQRGNDDFEKFLGELKKLDTSSFSSYKIPQKKLFKGGHDLQKQRITVYNDILLVATQSEDVSVIDSVKKFLDVKEPVTKENEESPDCENSVNLGTSNNSKAKPSDFDFLKVIGKGTFGQVYLAKHKAEGQYYAVKVLLKKHILKRNEIRHIMAEKNILMKNIKHPFLVTLYYSFQTKDKLYFVLSYINGGELFYHLQREKVFSECRVRFYATEIGLALAYMHSINILYRDLKPENLLLDSEGHIVLTDFGLSKMNIQDDEKTSTFCGTPEYLAPEILMKQPYNRGVDWWCYGCVIHELLFGLPPFYSRDTNAMYNNIVNQPLTFKYQTSPETKSLLLQLLNKNPDERLGAESRDFEQIKEHPFFESVNFEDALAKRIKPPFIPLVAHEGDTVNIDSEFTREPVPDSLIPNEDENHTLGEGNAFQGFTYVPQDE